MTVPSILEQAGGSVKSTRKTCRLRRLCPRQQIGTATIGRRENEIRGILLGLIIREFVSSQFKTKVGWGEKLSRQTGCVDRTPTRLTHLCTAHHRTQCTSTFTHHANTRGSRANTAQDCALWCLLEDSVIPASCLTCCRTCHRTPLHDLSHQLHLSSEHLLPHCPVLTRPILDWSIMKPCETHDCLHLPQKLVA